MSPVVEEISSLGSELTDKLEEAAWRPATPPASLVDVARMIYRQRRARSELFAPGFFGEPAWDILLDLYIETQSGRTVDITSATIASCVPATTALRWLSIMEMKGIIKRKACKADRRRTFVVFTQAGLQSMNRYLSGVVAN